MTCTIKGMCSRSPDCRDHRCEGHPINSRSLHRITVEKWPSLDALQLKDDPIYAPEQAEGWVMPTVCTALAFAIVIFVAVAYVGAPLVIPFAR